MKNITVIVPTYNGGSLWKESARRLAEQVPRPFRVKVIDSSSRDDTRETAQRFHFEVEQIDQKDFDHGGTRSYALKDIETEFVVFLTQDALLEGADAVSSLVSILENDSEIVCAYGRQLPHLDANPLASHARYSNYHTNSYVTHIAADFPNGFKKSFFSNSFSVYRLDFLRSIGGFPKHLILGEDACVAAKALIHNKKVAYVADAQVKHSHNYSVFQEFKRYFDIGVFHSTQSWMLKELGAVEGEGVKFAMDQLSYLYIRGNYRWILPSAFTSIAKYTGYKLGTIHKILGVGISRRLSMYKSYWNRV
jgi:rhamnosyltransferase